MNIYFGTRLAEIDAVCDYIPVISWVSNLVDLFLKCVVDHLPEKTVNKSRYWAHIKYKNVDRCLTLLIPIPVLGNVYILAKDYFSYKENQAYCEKQSQPEEQKKRQRVAAKMGASIENSLNGTKVTADEIMPTSSAEEKHLYEALFEDQGLARIQQLLDKKISPNFYHLGSNPLVTACQYASREVVSLLVTRGAQVNTPDCFGTTPFMAACMRGDLEIVQLLRPYITDIDVVNGRGGTPLMAATPRGPQELIAFLIQEGADVQKVMKSGCDAAVVAIFHERTDILPMLFKEGEDVNTRRYQFSGIQALTPLLFAALLQKTRSAMHLLSQSNIQVSDSSESTVLHYSVRQLELLEAVLAQCSSPEFINQKNILGETALHRAIALGESETALLLLKSGADPFTPKKDGKTPFVLACEGCLQEVVKYIHKHYADLNSQDTEREVEGIIKAAKENHRQIEPIRKDVRSKLCDFVITELRELSEYAARESILDPRPRTGMEILLGEITWPDDL